MKKPPQITCLFLDIGGVLLTDEWDHHARKRAATIFKYKCAEMDDRHQQSPEYSEKSPLTRDCETGLHRHYDRPGYWVDGPTSKERSR